MKKTKFEKYCLLFTIFIFGSFIGFILENLYTIVIKGNYALRQGLIYEPLIEIYGLGALTMYFLLKDKQKTDKFLILKIFIIGFLAGSLIEYICSYMQQNIFGTISWDYSKKMFNINGRINLFHSILWGLLGILFYYLLLPIIEQIKIKDIKSLAHTQWNCKYHVVFAPKYRRKVFYASKRLEIGEILRQLCEWKGITIIEAEVCPDHIHMLIEIPPKYSVSSVMDF